MSDKQLSDPLYRPLIANSILDLIGATPCVRLGRYGESATCAVSVVILYPSIYIYLQGIG